MAITGAHLLLYTREADEVRTILREVFEWDHVDAGDGWLIFAMPPAEVGIHPGDAPSHQISLMCDDIEATVAELRGKGIVFRDDPRHEGFGITTTMVLPGELEVLLYEPRHPTAS